MEKVNVAEKMAGIGEYWDPRIAGELNGQYVKLVRFKGEFDNHFHANEDEMFYVTKGSFRLESPEGDIDIGEGEFVIVPRGVEHKPVADEECHVILFEPATTLNTGNVRTEKTREKLDRI